MGYWSSPGRRRARDAVRRMGRPECILEISASFSRTQFPPTANCVEAHPQEADAANAIAKEEGNSRAEARRCGDRRVRIDVSGGALSRRQRRAGDRRRDVFRTQRGIYSDRVRDGPGCDLPPVRQEPAADGEIAATHTPG